jgi:hypothetical protein
MGEEITGYDPKNGACIVRDSYKLEADGLLKVEVTEKGAAESELKKLAELEKASFSLVRSYAVNDDARFTLITVFIEGRISVKPDGLFRYAGFNMSELGMPQMLGMVLEGEFLHSESEERYYVVIEEAYITQPLKQNEYAFIAPRIGIRPPSDLH